MKLTSEARLQIMKPISEVFDAIVNAQKLTKYFISESNGDLKNGLNNLWKFPEFDERFPITSVTIKKDKLISFVWDPETVVQIDLIEYQQNSTVVTIQEVGKEMNEENLKWLISNVGGWANFLASMKAYLEYGIELRKGAYDFMSQENG